MKKPSHIENENPVLSRITDLLIQKGISQKQLVEHLGLKKGTYTAWKANTAESYLKYIDEIATFLDVSPTFLLRGESDFAELIEIFQQLDSQRKTRLIEFARRIRDENNKE